MSRMEPLNRPEVVLKMDHIVEEMSIMERKEERQPVLVPVPRREAEREKEIPLKPLEEVVLPVPEVPRRWRVYYY